MQKLVLKSVDCQRLSGLVQGVVHIVPVSHDPGKSLQKAKKPSMKAARSRRTGYIRGGMQFSQLYGPCNQGR